MKVVVAHAVNFETLGKAFRSGDVALVECTMKSTGEKVATICATETNPDKSVSFTPFAIFLNGDPFELLEPPALDEPKPEMSPFEKVMAYESGEMNDEEMVAFFQEIIDSGLVWGLQGHYGRTAAALIERGVCHK